MKDEGPCLDVEGLHVRYGSRQVLRGLNLTVFPGEIYGMLGPNGAGKTTLIRTICGRLRPQAGRVTVSGQGGKARLRNVGLAPQELALYPFLTIRENLSLFGRLSGLSPETTRDAIGWASQATEIADRMEDRVEILSGGWKRRVNIAAAILHRPALLILDEPTVGVDVDARHSLSNMIAHLGMSGIAVLMATHDLDQAEVLCTRVGFLRDGVLAPQGEPRKLVKDTFQAGKELVLELRHLASDHQRNVLLNAGFTPVKSGCSWSRFSVDGSPSLEQISAALSDVGIRTREIRVREPGLDSLFLKLARSRETAS
jgi:ABC-2 type transport system ATP-binding protein